MGAFHFVFDRSIPLFEVEMSLHLAMFAVEGLVGQARVRLCMRYVLDHEAHAIVIEGRNRVSQTVAKVFAGLLLRELGEDAFTVERIANPTRQPQEAAA
jgi:hypothetical protein